MSMELTLYKVVPRSPIRGIGKGIIVNETEMELNELQALKILLAGNQLFKDDVQVTIQDFVPDVDPQCIHVGSLVDDPTNKGTKFTSSSECKVFGNPRDYVAPIIDATAAAEEETPSEGDNTEDAGTEEETP